MGNVRNVCTFEALSEGDTRSLSGLDLGAEQKFEITAIVPELVEHDIRVRQSASHDECSLENGRVKIGHTSGIESYARRMQRNRILKLGLDSRRACSDRAPDDRTNLVGYQVALIYPAHNILLASG